MKKQNLVLEAIKRNPDAANDDAVLISEVWRIEGFYIEPSVLLHLTRPETITRARRKLREEGKITESHQAQERREEAFRGVRNQTSRAVPWMKD